MVESVLALDGDLGLSRVSHVEAKSNKWQNATEAEVSELCEVEHDVADDDGNIDLKHKVVINFAQNRASYHSKAYSK